MKRFRIFLAVLCMCLLSCEKEKDPDTVDPIEPVAEKPALAAVSFSVSNSQAFNSLAKASITYSISATDYTKSGTNESLTGGSKVFENLTCPCTVTYQYTYDPVDGVSLSSDTEYDMSWSISATTDVTVNGEKIGTDTYNPSHSDKVNGNDIDEYIAVLNAIQPKRTITIDAAGNMTVQNENVATKGYRKSVNPQDTYVENLQATVTDDQSCTVDELLDKLVDMVKSNGIGELDESTLSIARIYLAALVKSKQISFASKYSLPSVDVKVRCIKYTYRSKDQNGKDIDLSSCMMWLYPDIPLEDRGAYLNKMLLYCPYTLLKESQCSTAMDGGFANAFILNDCLIVHPDYQGFGKTAGTPQLYLAHEVTSRQMYDAMCAAYKIFRDKGESLKDGWFSAPIGVSQGAGVSVATARYIDLTSATWTTSRKLVFNGRYGDPSSCSFEDVTTTGTLADLWNLKFTSCACGPYSPSETMRAYFKKGYSTLAGIYPVIIKAMILCYPDIMAGVKEEQYFSDKYLADKDMWDKIFLEKTMSSGEIQHLMNVKLGDPSVAGASDDRILLSDILSNEAMDLSSDISKKLDECFQRNELTSGWTPTRPIYLTTAPNDQIVPYVNSSLMLSIDATKVKEEAVSDGDHGTACVKWFTDHLISKFDSLQ